MEHKQVLTALVARFTGLQLIWTDGATRASSSHGSQTVLQRTLVIVKTPPHTEVFRWCNGVGSSNALSAVSIARGG